MIPSAPMHHTPEKDCSGLYVNFRYGGIIPEQNDRIEVWVFYGQRYKFYVGKYMHPIVYHPGNNTVDLSFAEEIFEFA